MDIFREAPKEENIQLSNPGFAVKVHSKGASNLIRSHNLESVGDKMKTRQAVSKQTREKLGQISTKSDTRKEVQAGVRK